MPKFIELTMPDDRSVWLRPELVTSFGAVRNPPPNSIIGNSWLEIHGSKNIIYVKEHIEFLKETLL